MGSSGPRRAGSTLDKCDLSEGIVTDDASGTITFHLVAPDPEFVYKLTIPFAYPVPPSVPDEERRRRASRAPAPTCWRRR